MPDETSTAAAPAQETAAPDTSSAVHNPVAPSGGRAGSTTLGGAQKLQERFTKALSGKKDDEPSTTAPAKDKEKAPAPEKKDQPLQSTEAKVPEEKASAEEKRGTDGRTPEERQKFLVEKDRQGKEVAELRAKAQAHDTLLQERDSLKTRLQELEAERESLSAKASAHDVREHPEYKKSIAGPKDRLGNFLRVVSEKNNLPLPQIIAAINSDDIQASNVELTEYAKNLDDITRSDFFTAVREARTLLEKERRLFEDAPKALAALRARETKEAEAKAKQAAEIKKVAEQEVWQDMSKKLPQLSEDEFAATVKADMEEIDWNEPSAFAHAKLAGAVIFQIPRMLQEKDSKIAQLEDTIAKLTKTPPKGHPTSVSSDNGGKSDEPFLPSKRLAALGFTRK